MIKVECNYGLFITLEIVGFLYIFLVILIILQPCLYIIAEFSQNCAALQISTANLEFLKSHLKS